jgi:hypothetical protein
MLNPMHKSYKWSRSFMLPHQHITYISLLRHSSHTTGPPHSSWFNHPNNTRWLVQIMKTLITQFSPADVISTRIGPNTRFTTLHSNTLSLCLPLNVSDAVSHTYKKQAKLQFHIGQSLYFCMVDGVTNILDKTVSTFPQFSPLLTS